jgi:cell wall assembly regulator SMI1
LWRELVASLAEDHEFYPPATPEQIAEVEQALGVVLPSDLKSLLYETNGINTDGFVFIWNTEQIKRENLKVAN